MGSLEIAEGAAPVGRETRGRNHVPGVGNPMERPARAPRRRFPDQFRDSSQSRLSDRAVEVHRFRRRRYRNHGVPPHRSTNAFQRTQNASTSGNAALNALCAAMTSAKPGFGIAQQRPSANDRVLRLDTPAIRSPGRRPRW